MVEIDADLANAVASESPEMALQKRHV
jgi:hypothetical protein